MFTSVRTHSLRTPEAVITLFLLSAVICALFPCSHLRVVFQLEAGNPVNQGFSQCQVTAFNDFVLYLSNTSKYCELVCVVLELLVVSLLPLAVACLLSFHYPVQLCVVRVESLTNLFLLILLAEGPGMHWKLFSIRDDNQCSKRNWCNLLGKATDLVNLCSKV